MTAAAGPSPPGAPSRPSGQVVGLAQHGEGGGPEPGPGLSEASTLVLAPCTSHPLSAPDPPASTATCRTENMPGLVSQEDAGPPRGPTPLVSAPFSQHISLPMGSLASGRGGGATGSQSPLLVSPSSAMPECRICLLTDPASDLVSPCGCTGSLQYAHLGCLKTWVAEKRSLSCELCSAAYRQPYSLQLAAAIPPEPPRPATMRAGGEGQPIIIVGTMVPNAAGGHHGAAGAMPHDVQLPPEPVCAWRNMWSYILILLLLVFAVLFVTVISKRGRQEPWMITLWQVLLVVLPIYLVLRIMYDLYRHRLAQQLAVAAAQRQAVMANMAGGPGGAPVSDNQLAAVFGTPAGARNPPHQVVITRAGNRILVLHHR